MDGTLGSQTAWMLDGIGRRDHERRGARRDHPRGGRGRLAGRGARDRRPREPRGARRVRGDPRRSGSRSASASGSSTRSASTRTTSRASRSSASRARCSSATRPPTATSPSGSGADRLDGAYAFRSLLRLRRGRRERLRRARSRSSTRSPASAPACVARSTTGRRGAPSRRSPSRRRCTPSTVAPAWLAGDERRRGRLAPGLPRRPRRARPRPAHVPGGRAPSRSRWSRRWSAAAGCTTRRPGTDSPLRGWAPRAGRRRRGARAPSTASEGAAIPLRLSGRRTSTGIRTRQQRPRRTLRTWPRAETQRTMLPVHQAGQCSVAATGEIVGSKWTVLIVHDLSEGPRRFTELEHACAGHQPAHARRAPALARGRGDRRPPELRGVAAARRVRADRQGRRAAADHRRDARASGTTGSAARCTRLDAARPSDLGRTATACDGRV